MKAPSTKILRSSILTVVYLLGFLGIVASGVGGDGTTTNATTPVVTTLDATNVTPISATISGKINTNDETVSAWFEWGTDSNLNTYFSTTPIDILPNSPATTINEDITGLTQGSVYFFRVTASNSAGTARGKILSFNTELAPSVITSPAIQLFPREATVSGSVNPNGLNTDAWFQLGFDEGFAAYDSLSPLQQVGAGLAFVPFDQLFDQLSSGTKYYYRMSASNAAGVSNGDTLRFTTPLSGDTCWEKIHRLYHPISITNPLDVVTSLEQTDDGGIVILVRGFADHHSIAIKTNSEGGVEWSRTFYSAGIPNPPNTFPYYNDPQVDVIKEIGNGNFIIAGHVKRIVSANSDEIRFWIAELDGNGIIAWQKTFEGLPNNLRFEPIKISEIEVLPDGYIVAGQILGPVNFTNWIFKTDLNGDITWQYIDSSVVVPSNENVEEIVVVNDGYIIVSTLLNIGVANSSEDIWVTKLDQNGFIVWQNAYGSTKREYASSATASANGVTITGVLHYDDGSGDIDVWVLNLANDGSINWQNTYGGPGRDVANKIQTTQGGGFLIGGYSDSFMFDPSTWLVKLSGSGSIERQKVAFGGISNWDHWESWWDDLGGGFIIGASHIDNGELSLIRTDTTGSCQQQFPDTLVVSVATAVNPITNASDRISTSLFPVASDIPNISTHVAIEQIAP